jgi:hypothetical protein
MCGEVVFGLRLTEFLVYADPARVLREGIGNILIQFLAHLWAKN